MLSSSSIFKKFQPEPSDENTKILDEGIAGINDEIVSMKAELSAQERMYKKALAYQPGAKEVLGKDLLQPHINDHEEAIETLNVAIEAHSKRLEALKKIKDSKPITSEELNLLLKMEVFQHPVISEYNNVEKIIPTP